jgi:hypothetical protein
MDGLRLVISVALALLFAFGLPALIVTFATPQLSALLDSSVWQAWALLAVGVVGALIGAPLAYIGAAPSSGRLRTGTLMAGAGALLALSFTAQWRLTPEWSNLLPGAEQIGALALTLPLLVAVGAAIGAQSHVSRAILAVARYIAARHRLVLLVAAIAGGWLGLTGAQFALSTVFQQAPFAVSLASGCGLIVGVALGLLLATPIGYLVRRFAFG